MVGHAGRQLFFQGDDRLGLLGREGDVVAVDAAAGAFAAVAVGTGKAGIHIDLADPAAETATQVVAVGIDAELFMDSCV